MKTIIKNVNVITMESDTILHNHDVLLENDTIITIGKNLIDNQAKVIDGTNKYLMPGLMDMHAHLYNRVEDLNLFLVNGITLIRNMWGEPKYNQWRDQILVGELDGPILYNGSPILDGDPPVRPADIHNITVTTVEQAKEEVLHIIEQGYDFVKVYNILSKEVYQEIARVSNENNIPFIGHSPFSVTIKEMIDANQKSIEHIDQVRNEDDIELLANSNVWVCPTLVVEETAALLYDDNADIEAELENPMLDYVDEETYKMWKSFPEYAKSMTKEQKQQMFEKYDLRPFSELLERTKKCWKAGVKLVLGTDTPNPLLVPGFSLVDELKWFVKLGMTPFEALELGTTKAAECLERDDIGMIQEGRLANMVLLNSNPFEDITNVTDIDMVFCLTKQYDRQQLDILLEKAKRDKA
jgi:imidazolonepropionase-like amidohydrolase